MLCKFFVQKLSFAQSTFTINSYHFNYSRAPRWCNDKESTCQCRRCKRHRFDPWSGRFPGVGNGSPLQSCLGNPMDRGAWRATVHGVVKSWTHRACAHTHTHTLVMIRGFIPAISAVLTGCVRLYSYSGYITRPCLTLHYLATAVSDQKSKYQNTTPRFSSGEGLGLILVSCACLSVYIFCNEDELHLGLGN